MMTIKDYDGLTVTLCVEWSVQLLMEYKPTQKINYSINQDSLLELDGWECPAHSVDIGKEPHEVLAVGQI